MITVDLFLIINNNDSGVWIWFNKYNHYSHTLEAENHYTQINLVCYYTSHSPAINQDDHESDDNIMSKF